MGDQRDWVALRERVLDTLRSAGVGEPDGPLTLQEVDWLADSLADDVYATFDLTPRRTGVGSRASVSPDDVRSLDRGVGELWREGRHHGWIACRVESFWGLGDPFRSRLRVWIRCSFPDGRSLPVDEDYPPYHCVPELLGGRWASADGTRYEVRWYDGDEREIAWRRHGLTDGPRP